MIDLLELRLKSDKVIPESVSVFTFYSSLFFNKCVLKYFFVEIYIPVQNTIVEPMLFYEMYNSQEKKMPFKQFYLVNCRQKVFFLSASVRTIYWKSKAKKKCIFFRCEQSRVI